MNRSLIDELLLILLLSNVQRIRAWAVREVVRLYGMVDVDDLDASFAVIGPALTRVTIQGKQQAIIAAWSYLAQKSALNGVYAGLPSQNARLGVDTVVRVPDVPVGAVRRVEREWADLVPDQRPPSPGVDVRSQLIRAPLGYTGTPIRELNDRAPQGVKHLIGQGVEPRQALEVSRQRALSVPTTEISYVARQTPALAVVEGGGATGNGWVRYRRVPSPGACSFCLMLASQGAVYHSEQSARFAGDGERFHTNCRCGVAAELDPSRVDEISIDPADAREIEVFVKRYGKAWTYNLGDEWYSYQNRAGRRGLVPDRGVRPDRRVTSGKYRPNQLSGRGVSTSRPPGVQLANADLYRPGVASPQRIASVQRQLEQLLTRDNGNPWVRDRIAELRTELRALRAAA